MTTTDPVPPKARRRGFAVKRAEDRRRDLVAEKPSAATPTGGAATSELAVQMLRTKLAHLSRVSVMGELSGAMSHELNQPLTGILSNARAASALLARDPPDLESVREALDEIASDAQRAGEIIHRMRGTLRRQRRDMTSLALDDVVREVIPLLSTDLVLHRTELELDLADDLPAVRGDRAELQQVVLNLAINALDAMRGTPPEGRRLTLRTACSDGRVELEVGDRGCGIAEEHLRRIFEPFFSTKPEGTGIGLAVVRSLVERHGGRVCAANRAGGGATLTVSLPLAAEPD